MADVMENLGGQFL